MKLLPILLVSTLIQMLATQLPSYPITPLVQASSDSKEQVNELISAGRKLLRTGNYAAALDKFQQGLLLAKKFGNEGAKVDALLGIGTVYNAIGQYPKALEYFQQSLKISQEIGDREGEGIISNNIGTVYIYLGQYPKALEYLQQSLTIKKVLGDKAGEEATLINIGAVYNEIGQYSKALEYYQPALRISRSREHKAGEEAVLNNMATVYKNLGQYPKALEYYQQSLAIKREIGNKPGEETTLNNIGTVYDSLGQYPKALEYYQQSLGIAQTLGDRAGEKNALNNIASVYESLEQYPKALKYFQQSLEIVQLIGDQSGEGTIFNNIGTVYRYLGQYSKSLEFLQKSLAIRKIIGDKAGEGNSIGNIGEVYRSLKQYPKALEYLQQSLTIRRMIGDQDGEGTILNNIGATFLDQKKPAIAEKPLRAAIAIWETIRNSKNNRGQGLSDRDKVSFADRVASTYRLLQKALIQQNKPQVALEVAERARARALVELLASKISTTNAASSQAIRQAPNLAKIQQIAKAKQATLVQYSIIDDEFIYIWVIKPNGEIVFKQSKLPPQTKLKDLIVATRQNIGAETRPENIPEALGDLQQLYKILIKPIAKDLPTNPEAEVIILPQRELFLVPFAALQDPQEKYLIEKHTLTIAPSIQVLGLTNSKRTRSSGKPVVVGNPIMPTDYKNQAGEPITLANLPGAETEARAVAEILQVAPLIGQAADKQQVVGLLQNSSLVHLATHGLLGTLKGDIPGAIVLTNGFLTASEIFDMQLQADLVVLSACDTGRGDLTGDGVVGLSRSLAVAGVPAVIVSLWEVSDDATKALMSEFYRNLRVKKLAKSQALRQAMLTTMQEYPKPVLWSAFMLVGEGH
jgi:CHAT domain-containing protein